MALSAKMTNASISVTSSSARTAYPAGTGPYVRVYNFGAVPIFIRSGDSSVAAALTDQFVPANATIVIAKDMADTNLAAITTTTAICYFIGTDSFQSTVG